jgi:hypothetical protein
LVTVKPTDASVPEMLALHFDKIWNFSMRMQPSYDLLQSISIDLIDLPLKTIYQERFNMSNSRAELTFKSYSKKRAKELKKSVSDIQLTDLEDSISSFQINHQQQTEEVLMPDETNDEFDMILESPKLDLNDFDDFKMPITCKQFMNFSGCEYGSQEMDIAPTPTLSDHLTQCGTRIYKKSPQVITAVKSDELEKLKSIKHAKVKKPLAKADCQPIVNNDKIFISYTAMINENVVNNIINNNNSEVKVAQSQCFSKSQSSVQVLQNNNSQSKNGMVKKAVKRRIFMKIGLNKQQKIKSSLHTDFLKTHLQKE